MMKGYTDLASLPEDERIDVIGRSVMEQKLTVAFFVDSDPPEKADRYIQKLVERFPGICIKDKGPGPIPGVLVVKVGPPA